MLCILIVIHSISTLPIFHYRPDLSFRPTVSVIFPSPFNFSIRSMGYSSKQLPYKDIDDVDEILFNIGDNKNVHSHEPSEDKLLKEFILYPSTYLVTSPIASTPAKALPLDLTTPLSLQKPRSYTYQISPLGKHVTIFNPSTSTPVYTIAISAVAWKKPDLVLRRAIPSDSANTPSHIQGQKGEQAEKGEILAVVKLCRSRFFLGLGDPDSSKDVTWEEVRSLGSIWKKHNQYQYTVGPDNTKAKKGGARKTYTWKRVKRMLHWELVDDDTGTVKGRFFNDGHKSWWRTGTLELDFDHLGEIPEQRGHEEIAALAVMFGLKEQIRRN